MTGNPCTKFTHYRMYVIGVLPQLACLDGEPVLHTERVEAKANFSFVESEILAQESNRRCLTFSASRGKSNSILHKIRMQGASPPGIGDSPSNSRRHSDGDGQRPSLGVQRTLAQCQRWESAEHKQSWRTVHIKRRGRCCRANCKDSQVN